MDRRSFLAAVLGAIGAPAAAKTLADVPVDLLGRRDWSVQPSGEIFYHFKVWAGATAMPGEVLEAELFPPPVPECFLLRSIYVWFPADALYEDVAEIVRSVSVSINLVAHGRAYAFPCQPLELLIPPRICSDGASSLGVHLRSDGRPLRLKAPTLVQVALSGLVRVGS